LHTASRRIINLLVQEGIGTLVIGKNANWKQEVEMGKRNNQQFVYNIIRKVAPHSFEGVEGVVVRPTRLAV
jgi:IS605 OrfB family transposase